LGLKVFKKGEAVMIPASEAGNRRKSPRIAMGVSILIPHLQTKILCHDLSREGCFFQGADLGEVGQTFSIILDLPETGLLPVEAQVAHKGEDGKSTGLQFIAIDPLDAEKLSYFVDIFQDT
jgi:hypothetical protein